MIYHPLFAKLSPSPSSNWAVAGSSPSFSGRPTLRNSTFQAQNDLHLKGIVVSLNGQTFKTFLDLNPIGYVAQLTLFYPLAIWACTFPAQNDPDLKGRVVSLNGQTLKTFSDLNPIGHGGHLTPFWPHNFLDEYFPGLVWPRPQKQSCQWL